MFAKLFLIALPVFFAIDMLWLGIVAKGFYFKHVGALLRPDVNWTAAIIFYVIFIAGLIIFVIQPAVVNISWTHALLFGALFGFIAYATYDLTNLATLKDWSLLLSVVDMLWGATLAAAVSVVTFWIASWLGVH